MAGNYVGFYTSRPIWAGEALDLNSNLIIKDFSKRMSHIEYTFNYDDFSLGFCKDGMILWICTKWEKNRRSMESIEGRLKWWNEYLTYLNCINLLIDNAVDSIMNHVYLDLSEVTNKDIINVTVENDVRTCHPPLSINSTILSKTIPNAPSSIETYLNDICKDYEKSEDTIYNILSTYTLNLVPGLFNWRLAVPKEVFDQVAKSFAVIVNKKHISPLIAGIAKSVSEYKVANYPISLTLAWFVIESIVQKKWSFLQEKNETLEDGKKRINKDRRALLYGRDYTISIISNILELSDFIPFDIFTKKDKVRRYRNKVTSRPKR